MLSEMLLSKKKILVVSYDAGGAEIISSYLKNKKILKNINFHLKGPALNIFKKKIKKVRIIKNIKNKIKFYNLIILGTSLKNNLEYNILKNSKVYKIQTICFLDHWVNYSQRFIRNKKKILPDNIVVGDKDAYKLAKKKFKITNIIYAENLYLKEFSNKIKHINSQNILFLSSNMNSLKNFKYSDEYIFKSFLNLIKNLKTFKNIKKIIIRKHPSEKLDKYVKFKKSNFNYKIDFDKNISLKKSLRNIKYAAGFGSMALVAAKIYGIKTVNLFINRKYNSTSIPSSYVDIKLKI